MATIKINGWTTWGMVRGLGPVRDSQDAALRDLTDDSEACGNQGGYSDRDLYAIDQDGYVVDPDTGDNVWPNGRTSRALKVEL